MGGKSPINREQSWLTGCSCAQQKEVDWLQSPALHSIAEMISAREAGMFLSHGNYTCSISSYTVLIVWVRHNDSGGRKNDWVGLWKSSGASQCRIMIYTKEWFSYQCHILWLDTNISQKHFVLERHMRNIKRWCFQDTWGRKEWRRWCRRVKQQSRKRRKKNLLAW